MRPCLVLLLGGWLAMIGQSPSNAQTAPLGRIAFSTSYENSSIGTRKPFSRSNNLGPGMFARYSPDGARITYMSGSWRTAEPQNIYLVNADGTGRTQLTFNTDTSIQDRYPCFTPDGSRIVFAHVDNRNGYVENIASIKLDGSDFRLLTQNTDPWKSAATGPICAPDGRIVYTAYEDYSFLFKLHVMNPDGTNVRKLTDIPGTIQIDADASPDGKKVAFCAFNSVDFLSAEVYTVNLDGPGINCGLKRITFDGAPNGVYNITPVYSPDSRWLVYSTGPEYSDKSYGIMQFIRADGRGRAIRVPNSDNAWPNSWR